jgi:hypothetical protein
MHDLSPELENMNKTVNKSLLRKTFSDSDLLIQVVRAGSQSQKL